MCDHIMPSPHTDLVAPGSSEPPSTGGVESYRVCDPGPTRTAAKPRPRSPRSGHTFAAAAIGAKPTIHAMQPRPQAPASGARPNVKCAIDDSAARSAGTQSQQIRVISDEWTVLIYRPFWYAAKLLGSFATHPSAQELRPFPGYRQRKLGAGPAATHQSEGEETVPALARRSGSPWRWAGVPTHHLRRPTCRHCVIVGLKQNPAATNNVVHHDHAAGPAGSPARILCDVVLFVGVDEHQVSRPPARRQRVQRQADDHLHPIGDARSPQDFTGRPPACSGWYLAREPRVLHQQTKPPSADLEDAARLDGTKPATQNFALLCRHRDTRGNSTASLWPPMPRLTPDRHNRCAVKNASTSGGLGWSCPNAEPPTVAPAATAHRPGVLPDRIGYIFKSSVLNYRQLTTWTLDRWDDGASTKADVTDTCEAVAVGFLESHATPLTPVTALPAPHLTRQWPVKVDPINTVVVRIARPVTEPGRPALDAWLPAGAPPAPRHR